MIFRSNVVKYVSFLWYNFMSMTSQSFCKIQSSLFHLVLRP